MKIEVIGCGGVVGSTTLEALRRFGYDVIGYDIDKEKTEVERIQPANIFFICTPEDAVEDVVKELTKIGKRELSPVIRTQLDVTEYEDIFIVVRSTVLPGTCEKLMRKYNWHICHIPEFLREGIALYDALRPDRIIIGECCPHHGKILEDVFKPLMAPIVRVDTKTSEMVKLVSNAHLSTLISFWNEVHLICKEFGVNSHVVGKIVSMDKRISNYGAVQHGEAFGGRCLPKDLKAFISFAEKYHEPKLLKAAREVNEEVVNHHRINPVACGLRNRNATRVD